MDNDNEENNDLDILNDIENDRNIPARRKRRQGNFSKIKSN